MSINWYWKDKIGELKVDDYNGEHTISIYKGNALMIFINEFKSDGVDKYALYNFISDIPHFRRCIEQDEYYFDSWKELTLYKWSKQIETMAGITARNGVRVVFELRSAEDVLKNEER